MTAPSVILRFADAREAADLAAFLARLIHYDRAAAVRVQVFGDALAVFGRPPSFEVLAIRTARLAEPGDLDLTVSAGRLADAIDTAGTEAAGGLAVTVPETVTGPPWAGVLPPRGGWRRMPGLPPLAEIRAAVSAAVAEFRARDEAMPAERRTRAERERIGREIWSRTLGETGLPLRVAHAAQALGFLRPLPVAVTTGAGAADTGAGGPEPLALLAAGAWLRLRTPYGSVAVRTTNGLQGLPLTPA
ncbi:hypothetical protein [Streptomyces sp. GC420]|uniref:hypothetical protein n=1 Tax=Streptomyces sp. GC420 TaxID=2697568 RepID=UPI001414E99E|nr:hypothetical protein [Streptomyces sp. GC420]NBM15559.1 hypothetical protein [Streptomyces sp. GC420]